MSPVTKFIMAQVHLQIAQWLIWEPIRSTWDYLKHKTELCLAVVPSLIRGQTYYFKVVAYDVIRVEGADSNQVVKDIE